LVPQQHPIFSFAQDSIHEIFVAAADTELQVLNEAYMQDEKPTLRRRAHTILLSNRGYTINQISNIRAVRVVVLPVGTDCWSWVHGIHWAATAC
jgi:hypothetical protein